MFLGDHVIFTGPRVQFWYIA